jgi:hypothetical protein
MTRKATYYRGFLLNLVGTVGKNKNFLGIKKHSMLSNVLVPENASKIMKKYWVPSRNRCKNGASRCHRRNPVIWSVYIVFIGVSEHSMPSVLRFGDGRGMSRKRNKKQVK